MSCEVCFQPFNLSTRYPLCLPCCNETICKECKLQIAGTLQQDTFQCPIKDCGEQNSCQANFKINKFAEKLLRESLSILCDKHPNDLAEFFCKNHEVLICTECTLKDHKNNDIFKINKKMLVEYHKIILEKLEIQYRRIAKLMETFEAYQKNQMVFTASKYIKTVKKAINILSPQMKTQEEKEMIKFLNQELMPIQENNQFEQIQQVTKPIIQNHESLIITNEDQFFIKECFGQANIRLELLYRGSRDTFAASAFHAKCDNQGPTLSVIKSQHNRVFGGYASVSWESSCGVYVEDANAFIISITNKTKHIQYQNYKNALVHSKDYGPIFGLNHDICINDNCEGSKNIFCRFGGTYSLPKGMQIGTNESQSYLAGSKDFTVTEIEVFKVIIY